MDNIPLINPALIKVVNNKADNIQPILKAEVIASTPVGSQLDPKQLDPKQAQTAAYKVLLQVGQQTIETLSHHNLKPGSQIEVKVLAGPELKIINSDNALNQASKPSIPASSTLLSQQLLADRIPKIHQQEPAAIIKQLTLLLLNTNKASTTDSQVAKSQAGSLKYQKLPVQSELSMNTAIKPATKALTSSKGTHSLQQRVNSWLQQLPQSQDIMTSTGLRNALNNAGIQAEAQLGQLAQQSLKLKPNNANSIFQQLQGLQNNIKAAENTTRSSHDSAKSATKFDLTSLVKKTAKILSGNSQQVLASLSKTSLTDTGLTHQSISSSSSPTTAPSQQLAATSNWQNPLLNNSLHSSLASLLQDPILQTPSSNNKLALGQLLGLNNHPKHINNPIQIPLNWPERSGNDGALLRNLQNLLGHIEREQVQQMQLAEGSQTNNPSMQASQNQQWLPLLFNHQQQLQLIEFFIDKEERKNNQGEKKNHWFINLHFELAQLGPIGIEISLFENECKTIFWSESSTTLSQISQHIQPLRQRLTEQGIIVSDIQSRHGILQKRKQNIQQRLVDIST